MSRAAAREISGQTFGIASTACMVPMTVSQRAVTPAASSVRKNAMLIAQRITLVDADDGRWQSCDIVGAGEDRPRQRILAPAAATP